MKLHEDKKLFHQAVQIASEQMNIPAIFVEKDYWISFVLHTIFHNKIGEETVFKGGTALVFHPNKAKIFAELETIWEELKTAYKSDFRKLVFGNFPNESEVLTTMKRIKERLKTIEWTITIENNCLVLTKKHQRT
jgi:hypothetical protein